MNRTVSIALLSLAASASWAGTGQIENFSSSKSNPGQFLSLRMAPVIAQIQPGSVAEKMGLRAGDRAR